MLIISFAMEEWELDSWTSGNAAVSQLCFNQISWEEFELGTSSIRFKDRGNRQLMFFPGKNTMRKFVLTFP